MDDLENKLGAILGNPEMMQQIMSLAQKFSPPEAGSKQEPPTQKQESNQKSMDLPLPGLPDLDLSMIQKLSGFASQSRIDSNQQSLLRALGPYLSNHRISKLEKAMRAAKMASIATAFLSPSGR